MSLYTEREGILVTREGIIHLRHEGKLREVKGAIPLLPAKDDDPDPDFWGVLFTDKTMARIGRPLMKAALMRRLMECPINVLFPEA